MPTPSDEAIPILPRLGPIRRRRHVEVSPRAADALRRFCARRDLEIGELVEALLTEYLDAAGADE